MDGMHQRSGRSLLTASARPWAGRVLAGCVILVVVLGALFAHQATADRFDQAVDSPFVTWFRGDPQLALWLAFPGTLMPAVVLSAAMVIGCLLTGRLAGAVLAAVAVPVTAGLNEALLKPLVHRTYLGQISYPSGHTATIFALAATAALLLLATPRPPRPVRPVRIVITVVACGLGCVVAIGVIGLRWHYFTDTLAGAAVGIGTVCGLALLLDLPAIRRWLTAASGWRR
jgi:membrane-associated phospholipid phosphatase